MSENQCKCHPDRDNGTCDGCFAEVMATLRHQDQLIRELHQCIARFKRSKCCSFPMGHPGECVQLAPMVGPPLPWDDEDEALAGG